MLCLFTTSSPASADSQLDELRRIADSGAIQLTLSLFDQQSPELSSDPAKWALWEQARLAFYVQHEQWRALLDHIDSLSPAIPDGIRIEAETYRATALLAMNRPAESRAVLRSLIWRQARTAEQINNWRQLIIRSYLHEGSANSANTAMLRYEQDYGKVDTNGLLLRGRVLLLAGRDKDAAELLEKKKGVAVRAVYLLAALRSAHMSASNVLKESQKVLKNKKLGVSDRLRFLAVLAEAAAVEHNSGQRISAIEEMYALSRKLDIDEGLFKFDDDMLWKAYTQQALHIANEKQLLVGDDAAWLKETESYKKDPQRQRAMYAWLASNAANEKVRNQSHQALVKSLQQRPNGLEVIRHLYRSAINDKINTVPPVVGYVLIDQALSESDIKLASSLLGELVAPPEGIDPMLWHLRRARVFVLAGDYDSGVKVLYRLLSAKNDFNKQQTDRFMQVLFDLQTVGRHGEAYDVFSRLYEQSTDPQLRREILYWMADSRVASKEYKAASQLYLQSARSPLGDDGLDLWGQSAYYQAAEALAKAGFIQDARNLYERLLEKSTDPARRAVLSRQLQQLLLQQQVVDK